ncbi:MAG: sigma-70 family RNA polymerase sigma factor [Myxococcales bacterium]
MQAAIAAHYELVWRILRRLGVAEPSVEDAAQQVLIVLANRLDDIRTGAERAFMVATATRVAADLRKKRTRAREDLDLDAIAAARSSTPLADELLDRSRARQWLDVVLNEMPDEQRAVFVLFELEEMTMATIGELLGLPLGTVASRLRRARATFETAAALFAQPGSRP